MTRAFQRTNFHGSKLIRCLVDLGIADAVDPGNAFAEKLGSWIHFADAITLSAVHGGSIANPPGTQAGIRHDEQAAAHAAGAELDRMQALLTNSIRKSCSSSPGRTHMSLPAPSLELPLDLAKAYAPYRRFYEAHQRDMESSIQPLRTRVREAVAKASPRLRKLADLDATLERILRERESRLLMKVPALLGKRFGHLFKEHQRALAGAQQADNPAAWMQAGGWLDRFRSDMQMLLLAEVEFRLQPTMGLIEAFKQDT